MIFIPVEDEIAKIGGEYLFTVLSFKRARQLMAGEKALVEVSPKESLMSIIIREIKEDKLFVA